MIGQNFPQPKEDAVLYSRFHLKTILRQRFLQFSKIKWGVDLIPEPLGIQTPPPANNRIVLGGFHQKQHAARLQAAAHFTQRLGHVADVVQHVLNVNNVKGLAGKG